MEIRELAVTDEEAFADWHDAMRDAYLDGRQAVWWSALEETRASFAKPSPHRRRLAIGAFDDHTCVGGAELVLPDDADTETVDVELGVRPAAHGRGVGAALWEWVVRRCAAEERTVAQLELDLPPGQEMAESPSGRFALARGFTAGNVEHRMIIDLPSDLHDLARRLNHTPGDPAYRVVSWTDRCPDALLSEFARLSTMMEEDVPSGEMTRTARRIDADRVRETEERMTSMGWVLARSMALDSRSRGAGYTEIMISRHEKEFLIQDDTLVDRDHRGHGLGMALKSANLHAVSELPDELMAGRRWLQTYTATTNTPMLRVNERFGFRTVDVLHECEARL